MKLQPILKGLDAFGRIKAVKDLTKPKQDAEYFDLEGQKVEVSSTDKFNLIVDSKTGLAARVIFGKVVLEAGEDRSLPFGMDRTEIEGSFGEKSKGNIFVDSRGAKSEANDSIAIRSANTFFDSRSYGNLVVDSPDSRFLTAAENGVFRSTVGIYYSHHNREKDGGVYSVEGLDIARTDIAYMPKYDQPDMDELVNRDSRNLIINIDEAKVKNPKVRSGEMPAAPIKLIASELIEVTNSPGLIAELASGGTVVDNSPGANLYNVNSNDTDGTSVVKNSEGLHAHNANYITVDGCPFGVFNKAHYLAASNSPGLEINQSLHVKVSDSAKLRADNADYLLASNSPELKVRESLNVHASDSGHSLVDESNRAELDKSPYSKHIASEGSVSIESSHSEFNMADNGLINLSEFGAITYTYGGVMDLSPHGRMEDAQEASLNSSPGTELISSRMTSVTGIESKLISDRPHEILTTEHTDQFPLVSQSA